MRRTISEFHQVQNKEPEVELPQSRDYYIGIVLTIIKEAIEKLKISFILPKIFENPITLKALLKGSAYEECLDLVVEYREQRKHEAFESPTKSNYQLLNVIDYFHENHNMLEFLTNWLDDIDEDEKVILDTFVMLSEIALERFNKDARQELAKEKHIHEVFNANERIKKDIKDIMAKIEGRKINNMWKAAAKTGVVKDLDNEWEARQYDNAIQVSARITESNQEMLKLNSSFVIKQKELEEEYEKVHSKYENELKIDLKKEKLIRDEKNKFQSQLELLIKKYDQTMADKNSEELYFNDEYDKLKLEFEEFMLEYDREYSAYDQLVGRWEKERLEKISLFSRNYAARRIQRWWRSSMREKKKRARQMANKGKKSKRAVTGKAVRTTKEVPKREIKTKSVEVKKEKKK